MKHKLLDRANAILGEIGEKVREIEGLQSQVETEMEQIRDRYAKRISEAQSGMKSLDKIIMALMKDNSDEIFRGGDKIALENGWLLYTKDYKVKIPRGTVEKLEALGWDHLVRISKSVDRGAVEKLSESDMAKIGAEKKEAKKYAYEIRDHS